MSLAFDVLEHRPAIAGSVTGCRRRDAAAGGLTRERRCLQLLPLAKVKRFKRFAWLHWRRGHGGRLHHDKLMSRNNRLRALARRSRCWRPGERWRRWGFGCIRSENRLRCGDWGWIRNWIARCWRLRSIINFRERWYPWLTHVWLFTWLRRDLCYRLEFGRCLVSSLWRLSSGK